MKESLRPWHSMNRRAQFCCLVLGLVALATACRWDRDTLADEAKGSNLEIIKVIVGRFDRNPPLYYQMRLDRVSKELAREPGQLDLYNDAAVACDHLGRFDEAISWMQKQEKVLETARVTPDVMYRFNANLGTFYAHRWVANKSDLSKLGDLEKGIHYIKRAIEINPDAHFGREKFQLALMEWAKDGAPDGKGYFGNAPLTNYLGDRKLMDWNKAEDAVEGLAGLIRLGTAWESVDVFAALAEALILEGLGTTGEAALARVEELQIIGKTSVTDWRFNDKEFLEGRPLGSEQAQAKSEFKRLRQEADKWHEARTKFMLAKLEAGQHPDTDPGFWNGYSESKMEVKNLAFWKRNSFAQDSLIFGILAGLVIGFLILGWVVIRVRRQRRLSKLMAKSNESEAQQSGK